MSDLRAQCSTAGVEMRKIVHRAADTARVRELIDLVSARKPRVRSIRIWSERIEIEDADAIVHIVSRADGRVTSSPRPDPTAGQLEMFS